MHSLFNSIAHVGEHKCGSTPIDTTYKLRHLRGYFSLTSDTLQCTKSKFSFGIVRILCYISISKHLVLAIKSAQCANPSLIRLSII
jgi:hypothetical protein